MTTFNDRARFFFLLSLLCLVGVHLEAQVNVQVRINSGSSTTTCTDGFFGGGPEPHFRVEVAGQGYTTYQSPGICFTNTPNTQYSETFDCSMPASLQVCLRAFEDDGTACIVGQSCLEQNCQNFAVPAPGNSINYNLNVGGSSTATINFTITSTGTLVNQGNDFICGALDLGTLGIGNSLGNENSYIYNNICATGTANGDVNPPTFSNEYGVWLEFTTGTQIGTEIIFEFESDGGLGGTFGDLLVQASIFESSDGTCTGTLTEVGNSDDVIDLSNNETIDFQCPKPSTTYYILVDGGSSPIDFANLFDEEHGYFGIGIYDNGIVSAADYICDAEYMGTPSPGNSVTTAAALQSNICATIGLSGTQNDPVPGASWSTDSDEQQGVWFEFTAPASGSVNIDINSTAQYFPILTGQENLDAYVAIFSANADVCSPGFTTGNLQLIGEQHSYLTPCGIGNDLLDESFDVFCLEPGENYFIFVDGDDNIPDLFGDGVSGNFSIVVSDLQLAPAPNDDVCNATAVNGGVQLAPNQTVVLSNQSNHCATDEVEPVGFGWDNNQGVWYSFVAPPSGAVEIWTRNYFEYFCVPITLNEVPIPGIIYEDGIRLEMAVFGAAPTGITCLGSPTLNQNDDILEPNLVLAESDVIGNDVIDGGLIDALNDEYIFVECLIPGDTYYVLVDGYEDGFLGSDYVEGTFEFEIHAVDQTAPTGNDLPCNAVALGDPTGGNVGGATVYNNYCATVIAEPDVLGFNTTQTVWFTFIAPGTGSVNIVATEGNDDIDLQIAVFVAETDCSGLLSEISSDDSFADNDAEIDQVHCLTPGETYYLLVDGEPEFTTLLGYDEGEFTLSITEIPSLPNLSLNNLICDANNLGNPFTGAIGTTLTLTDENNLCANNLNDPEPSCFDTDYTVWYEFTTPANLGQVAVEIFVESEYWTISDPFNFNFDAIDPQVAVFVSDPNDCTGVLSEVACSYTFDINIFDAPEETVLVECLEPSTTYYVMVDGATTFVGDIGFGQGNFDVSITTVNTNPTAPNNDVCEFIDLGQVPAGGSIPPNTDYYNFCADTEPGEPAPFGLDQTVWFAFTAPNVAGANVSSGVTINAYSDPNNLGDEINLQLAVYSSDSDCTGSLTLVDSEFDGILYGEDLELTCLVPGQEYFIQVDGADNLIGGVEGYFTLEIIDDGAGMFPTNDDVCATAHPLGTVPDGSSINPGTTFSNLCATIEAGEPDPGFGLGLDDIDQTVWFTFSPPASGNVLIDADSDGSDNVDLQLAVYYSSNGTCDPTTFVPINHEWDGAGLAWDEDLTITCLDPSATYYLQVDGSSITENLQGGNFTLELNDLGGSTVLPYNNDMCDAHDFGTIATSAGLAGETNECADIEPNEPGIFGFAQHTVWYQFNAPASGRIEIVIDPASILDLFPEVHLYSSSTGDCTGTMTEVDSDILPDINGDAIITTPCMVSGQTYFIQVDGQLVAPQGLFDITLTNPEPNYGTGTAGDAEPSNNECMAAIPLPVQGESCFIGDGIWDTENYGEPTISINDAFVQGCNGNGNCGDTWYCFTMPPSGAALVEGNDDNGFVIDNDLTIIAYTGDCTGLTALDCEADDEVSYEVAAPAGTKVYLQVFDGGLDYPNEDFQLCVSEQCGADNCLNAVVMENEVAYCWNTSSSLGENLASEAGYGECGDSSDDPEHSVYFSFTSDCNGGSILVSVWDIIFDENDPTAIPCSSIGLPEDAFSISVLADTTPCDNNPDDLVWCDNFDGCDYNYLNNSSLEFELTGLNANTQYIIQLEGGVYNLFNGGETGGNSQGQIMITTLTSPSIDSMVVVDSIPCTDGTGAVTAEVSGGVYPYTYVWTDSIGTNIGTDSIYAPAQNGWNYVTITSDNGCEEIDSVYLPEPLELLSDIFFDPTTVCYGQPVAASVTASGGTPDYAYEWSNGEMIANPTMLESNNTYSVTITDNNGCTSTEEIIVPPVQIVFIRD